VIDGLEDSEDYRGFEAAGIARTAVEREHVLRFASLLWRMRRAISIETDLLRIQSEIVRKRRAAIGDRPVRCDVMMPSVWDARSRSAIHSIRFVDGCHWSLPISFMTVVTI
jgi:hypothetical protein